MFTKIALRVAALLTAISVAIAIIGTAVLAQQLTDIATSFFQSRTRVKQDIRAFYTGMRLGDFEQQLESIGCKLDRKQFLASSEASCKATDGSFAFRFTKNLETNVLYEVAFQFESGTTPPEMITLITSQYGVQPRNVNKDWGVGTRKSDTDSKFHSLMATITGIRISMAEWSLSEQALLELKGIGDYELRLYSQVLALQDDSAFRLKRELEQKNLNPTPKF